MEYPEVGYVLTSHDDYLELNGWDGTCRGVIFRNASAARDALRPGRAELDCVAISHGLLPAGSTLVSRAGISATIRFDDPEALRAVQTVAAASQYLTPEKDGEARVGNPGPAARYDAAVQRLRMAECSEVVHH